MAAGERPRDGPPHEAAGLEGASASALLDCEISLVSCYLSSSVSMSLILDAGLCR